MVFCSFGDGVVVVGAVRSGQLGQTSRDSSGFAVILPQTFSFVNKLLFICLIEAAWSLLSKLSERKLRGMSSKTLVSWLLHTNRQWNGRFCAVRTQWPLDDCVCGPRKVDSEVVVGKWSSGAPRRRTGIICPKCGETAAGGGCLRLLLYFRFCFSSALR